MTTPTDLTAAQAHDSQDVGRAGDGPPARFSDREWPLSWMGAFLDALAVMPVVASAARQAGVARAWTYESARNYPAFAQAWDEAYRQGVEVLEQHVHRWGTVGITLRETRTVTRADGSQETAVTETVNINPQIAMFALKRHKPEYRDTTRVEMTGAGGGPVSVEVNRTPSHERLLELAQLARDLELPARGVPAILEAVPTPDV